MSFYREQLTAWLKTLDISADKVLDIGGSANPVSKRVKSWDVKKYHLLDNQAEKSFHDKWEYPHFPYDIQKVQSREVKDKHGHIYDVVFCLEVFEYIIYPAEAIHNIHSLMKEGGILYITFPFVYPFHQPIGMDCLRYTKTAVEMLLRQFSEVTITPRIDQSGALVNFYQTDGMRMAKGEQHNITGFLVKAIK